MAHVDPAATASAAALRASFSLQPLAGMNACLPPTADTSSPVIIVGVGAKDDWLTRASQHLSAFSLCEAHVVNRAHNFTAYSTVNSVQAAIRATGVEVPDPCKAAAAGKKVCACALG